MHCNSEMVLRILAQFLGSLTFYYVFVVSLWDIGLTSIHEQRLVHRPYKLMSCFVPSERILATRSAVRTRDILWEQRKLLFI